MKRNALRILALTLALVFCMGTLIACREQDPFAGMTEAERAFALYAMRREKTDAVSSYTASVSITGSFSMIVGNQIATGSIFAGGSVQETGIGTDSFMAQTDVATNMTITSPAGDAITQVQTEKKGFQNGFMYAESTQDNELVARQFSTISVTDYVAYRDAYEDLELGVTASSCTTATSTLQEDGNWRITFTGFTADFVARINETVLSGFNSLLMDGQRLSDVQLSYTLGADYLPKQAVMEFVFANEDPSSTTPLPVMTQTQTYSDFNVTTMDPVDLTGYSNVGDLRQIFIYRHALSKRADADMGSFETSQQVTAVASGQGANSTSITLSGAFTNLGGFTYTITGSTIQNGMTVPMTFSYHDKTFSNGETETTSTDVAERARLRQFMDPAGVLSGTQILSVTAGTLPNTYVFTTTGLSSQLAAELPGATIQSGTETLTVTYDANGMLTSSVVNVNITLVYMGVSVTMTTTITCTHK